MPAVGIFVCGRRRRSYNAVTSAERTLTGGRRAAILPCNRRITDRSMMEPRKTVLHDRHVALGARMVEFGGWRMPLQYPSGIVQEHLATRRSAGLFDVSHMGRFAFRGPGALGFLQHVLTNDAARLAVGEAQYTIAAHAEGGAVDDAYLYRFDAEEYLLVVNAANRRKDLDHFQAVLPDFAGVEPVQYGSVWTDRSDEQAMLSLQGPLSGQILAGLIDSGRLPEPPQRNRLSTATIRGRRVRVARTGYTGEPLCFELFAPAEEAAALWDLLVEAGVSPVGLGARDTLRLEANLPLYGHELGADPDGRDIPVLASPSAAGAVSLSPRKGDFIGRGALGRQHEAFKKIACGDFSSLDDLPRIVRPVAVTGKAIARAGDRVFGADGRHVGYVTSGTMVPYWKIEGESTDAGRNETGMRPIGLALLDGRLGEGDDLSIEVRGRRAGAVVVSRHLRSEGTRGTRPVGHGFCADEETPLSAGESPHTGPYWAR